MGIKILVRQYEHIGAAVRRLKKQVDRSGLMRELRDRSRYEKPCEVRRRAKLRKLHNAKNPKVEKPERERYYAV